MKILMIGNRESGKTTYMASAFGMLNKGVADFHIETDSNTLNWYQRLFEAVKDGRYPLASDKRDSHEFRLSCLGKNVLDFEWIDYNGGVIRTIDADELMRDISTCDGVMLFFDAVALLENAPIVHQLRRILTLIAGKLESVDSSLFSVILVVTKVDLLRSKEDYDISIAPLSGFLENVRDNDNIYARVIPVSCTKTGFYNVELPILDILDSGLRMSYLEAAMKVKDEADAAVRAQSKSGVIDWIFSKLDGVPTYGEIAQNHIREAEKQLKVFQSIEEPMEKLKNYVQSYQIVWPEPGHRTNSTRTTRKRGLIKF